MELSAYPPGPFGEGRRTPGRHGYTAYFPAPLPRAIELPARIVGLLAEAESALGQLAAGGRLIPNPDHLVRPYLLREAVSSTRIEGTRATLDEVFEADAGVAPQSADIEEVVNYVEAMRWGIERLSELPLSSRLIREMHRRLMAGVRGRESSPGELRTTQNWIGPVGSTIESAPFVPPPPSELPGLLADWGRFADEEPEMPLLVRAALLHAQFETIHPFLDGNGRLGRLLLVFFLVVRERLPSPLLYLSSYLERNRSTYYDSLQAIRGKGDATPWLDLFLTGVQVEAADAVQRAQQITALRELLRESVSRLGAQNAPAIVELIFDNPILTTKSVENALGVSRPTALRLLRRLAEQGIVMQREPGARGQRRYVALGLLKILAGDSNE